MNDQARYWFFLKKVHERLTILFQHNVPNRIPIEEADEQLYKEMHIWFLKSDLFSASDPKIYDNSAEQLSILNELSGGIELED